ncbi:unnamed protein product [Tuber melanosporum]|uniref:(Perigord truffle) hypothetical protein n=1 Tax=Tuber melanosporum (strain Mel28) TaxID=656061 RepID=D5G7J4_TUBMM|nr:uncharacterized protein GSTUM_00002601001 [Tuber melanosporum]CAZ80487.1 unnamed protein product [Tuber melanosporum]
MSCHEYQEVGAILRDPGYTQDLFHCFQKVLDERLKSRYGNKFTGVINDDDSFLLLLRDMVAAHSDAQAESSAICPRHTGEQHTEGQYFEENWPSTLNPPNPELARLNTLFFGSVDCSSSLSRAESVQQAIANVDQQLPEDTTMSDSHSQNQLQQQAQPPASPPPEMHGTNTAHPQNQQMGTQQLFSQVFGQKNARQPTGNHTSDSGESSGAQSDISFTSSRKPSGKRVAGRWACPVEDCPKRGELMQKCRLDDHMARHQPERRTHCPSCDKIYLHSRTCNEHHKKAHGMDLKSGYERRAYLFTQQAASLGDMEGSFTEEEAMAGVTTH